MPDYKKMYFTMFNAATDANRLVQEALMKLKTAQSECEEIYMDEDDQSENQ